MDKEKIKKYLPRVVLILFFVIGSSLIYFFSLEGLIQMIGVSNSYVLIFILAFLGGLTTFSMIPYHWVLAALAAGGLNPLLLGSVAAVGVFLGDSTSYFVGYQGGAILPQGLQNILQKIYLFALKYPRALPVFFFLYGSLCPFSNDFIVISMGLARYPFWRVMIPLGLGNFVFNTMIAFLAFYAYDFLQGSIIFNYF